MDPSVIGREKHKKLIQLEGYNPLSFRPIFKLTSHNPDFDSKLQV